MLEVQAKISLDPSGGFEGVKARDTRGEERIGDPRCGGC